MSIRKIDHTYIKTRGANTNDILRVVGTELQYVSANSVIYANILPLLSVKANIADLTTANVVELNNLYYTNTRVYSNVAPLLELKANVVDLTTSNVLELNNLYYTNTRVYSNVAPLLELKANVVDLTTSNVLESASSLYYTNARVRSTLSAGTGVLYDKTTGIISIGQNVDSHANVTFNEMTVTGNLNVVGNLVGFYANTLVVNDPLIQLGYGNPSDALDLGFIGHYNDGIERHAGLFRDASDKKFKFFDNITGEPSSATVDAANATFRLANVVATTFEGNVVGNVTGYVSSISNFTTSNLTEGNDLYYTNARVISAVTPYLTTANVVELNNLYYTNTRVYSNVAPLLALKANVTDLTTSNVVEGNNLYYTNSRVYSNVAPLLALKANVTDLTTSNVVEGNNLYYTNSRVYSNILAVLSTYSGNLTAGNLSGGGSITGINTLSANTVIASVWTGLYTANVIESPNALYYTNARVYSNVAPLLAAKANVVDLTTANVVELNNLYYTNTRVYSNIAPLLTAKANVVDLTTANVVELNNLYYTNSRVYSNVVSILPTYAGNISAGNAIVGTIISGAGGGGSLTGANLLSANNVSALNWLGIYTANVVESASNLYFTNARVYANILALLPTLAGNNIIIAANGQISANLAAAGGGAASSVLATGVIGLNTANVNEFGSNLYYTNTRVYSNVAPLLALKANVVDLTTANVVELNNLYYTNARVYSNVFPLLAAKANVVDLTTSNVVEGTNLYYTNSRVYSNVISILPTYTGNISAGNAIVGTIISGAGGGGSLTGANLISTNNISAINWQGLYSANVIESQSALFFSNARVLAGLAGQNLDVNNVIIRGDLIVEGNTVTLNTGTLIVEDRNIMLANGATNSATADGAGINITGAQANLTYRSTGDKFEFNKPVDVLGTLNANTVYANIWTNLYTNNVIEGTSLFYTNARVYSNVLPLLASKANVTDLTTSNVVELNNLYYTNSRVYSNVISILPTYSGNLAAGNLAISGGGSLTGANLISANNLSATNWLNLYTANVIETASNLYFTNARVYSNVLAFITTLAGNNIIIAANGQISANLGTPGLSVVYASNVIGLNTANVNEFGGNLYYTNARVYSNVITLLPTLAGSGVTIAANGQISASAATPSAQVVIGLNTANVNEFGSNLYYTNSRVYSNVISLLPTYTGNLAAGNLAISGDGSLTGANLISANNLSATNWLNLYTANVIESASNLYFTNARVYANVIGLINAKGNVTDLTTANVIEFGTNLYYTNSRVYSNVIALLPTLAGSGVTIAANGQISASGATPSAQVVIGLNTANVNEFGGNLYYTNARVYSNVITLLPTLAGSNIIIAANGQISATGLTVPGPNSLVILSNSKIIPTVTSQLSYMMTANVTNPENILVILNGITQRPGVDYTVNNTTLTFASAPPNGNVEIRSFGEQAAGFISAANVTTYISNSRTFVGGNTYYNLGSNVALARNILVALDGLTLIPDVDYTVNGSNLTLIGGSSTNSSLEVKFFGAEAYNPVFTASIVTAALGSGISGNILPSASMVYNLGSPTLRWKDLYLSGNTINLDGAVIKNDNGIITFTDSTGTTSAASAAKAVGYSLIFGG